MSGLYLRERNEARGHIVAARCFDPCSHSLEGCEMLATSLLGEGLRPESVGA